MARRAHTIRAAATLGLTLAVTALAGPAAVLAGPVRSVTASAPAPAGPAAVSALRALRSLCGLVNHGASGRELARAAAPVIASAAVRRFVRGVSGRGHGPCLAVGHPAHGRQAVVHVLVSARAVGSGYVISAYRARTRPVAGARTRSATGARTQLIITGPSSARLAVSASDPLTGRRVAVNVRRTSAERTVITLALQAYPRLIVLSRLPERVPTHPSPVRAGAPTTAAPSAVSSPLLPFARSGPWRSPLSDTVALDPHSASIVSDLTGQIQTYYGHAALNTSTYSAPIYTVPATQPTVTMAWNNCQGKPWLAPAFASALQHVPVPDRAMPSLGSDGEIVIWQPSTDREWEFWKMAQNPTTGVWSACWGGRIDSVSQNPGIFPAGSGATASGLPLLGFLVRVDELRTGSIDHAINLELPKVRAGTFSWPANRTDGSDANPLDPAEGERFRLDPALDLSTLNLTPGELMIARALQRYGAIVTDKSGAVAVQAEDPRPYELGGAPDPYTSFFSGPQYSWLKDIPWSRMQAVAFNYGRPAG